MENIMTLMPLVLLIFIMYFLLIRPQKKREKAVQAMRNAIRVGDEVITIGGICGKIVKTKDDTLTIQVGADKTKFDIMRWAVSKVVTDEPAPSNVKKAKKEEVEEEVEATKKTLPKKIKKFSNDDNITTEEPSVIEEDPAEATADIIEAEIEEKK